MVSCNVCRNGRKYFGSPCTNGCPFHVFPDGTVLSFRWVKISGDPDKDVMGDVWGYRLHRGVLESATPERCVPRFYRTDEIEYNPADYPA
jgi:hypothetical protein